MSKPIIDAENQNPWGQAAPRELPNWMDEYRLPDGQMAQAYESIAPVQRALLKTALAFHFQHLSPFGGTSKNWQHKDNGFVHYTHKKPLPWLLVLVDSPSPARLLGAIMPALMCGICPVVVGKNFLPSQCLALELAGVEEIFTFPTRNFIQLSLNVVEYLQQGQHLPPNMGQDGKILVLGEHALASKSCWLAGPAPSLYVAWPEIMAEKNKQQLLENILFAHPDANMVETAQQAQAVYLPQLKPVLGLPEVPLCLAPPLEACWVFPDLHQDFFFQSYQSFAFYPDEQ